VTSAYFVTHSQLKSILLIKINQLGLGAALAHDIPKKTFNQKIWNMKFWMMMQAVLLN
jgi:hypothetical protein